MTTAEAPNCSICGEPMAKLPRTTGKKMEDIFVCNTGKDGSRPCDGGLFRIATLER